MSALINGKPMWCRPAPTRDYDFGQVGTGEPNLLLSQAPRLVAEGIRAGLVHRPEPVVTLVEKLGANSEWATCSCGQTFARKRGGSTDRCFICRTPAIRCRCCHDLFHPPKRGQKTCSQACRIALIKRGAAKNAKPPRMADCPICGVRYVNQTGHRKTTKTCSKLCGIELMKRTQKATRETK